MGVSLLEQAFLPRSLCAVTCDPEKMRALRAFQAGVVNAQALSFPGLGNLEKGKGDLTQSPTVIVEAGQEAG